MAGLKLRKGTELIFAISQDPETGAYILRQRMKVGSHEPDRTKPERHRSEEELWSWWLKFGDEQLARVGLEKTRK